MTSTCPGRTCVLSSAATCESAIISSADSPGKQHEFPSAPPRTHRHHGGGPGRIADLHAMGRQTRFVGGDRIDDDPRLLEAVIEQFDPGQAPNQAGPAVGADEESRARAIFSAAGRGDRRGCAALIVGGDPGQAVAGQNFEPRTLGEPTGAAPLPSRADETCSSAPIRTTCGDRTDRSASRFRRRHCETHRFAAGAPDRGSRRRYLTAGTAALSRDRNAPRAAAGKSRCRARRQSADTPRSPSNPASAPPTGPSPAIRTSVSRSMAPVTEMASVPHHRLDCADPIDLDADPAPAPSGNTSAFLSLRPDTARRAREDQVARLQRHGLAEVFDLLPEVEDQVTGVGVPAGSRH